MNRLERRFLEEILLPRQAVGEVHQVWYERMKLKIGHDCWLLIDFVVQLADGTLELHEVKGHMEDDAYVKYRAAADEYPFRLILWRWSKKTGWVNKEF